MHEDPGVGWVEARGWRIIARRQRVPWSLLRLVESSVDVVDDAGGVSLALDRVIEPRGGLPQSRGGGLCVAARARGRWDANPADSPDAVAGLDQLEN